jgi:hypothetical protein
LKTEGCADRPAPPSDGRGDAKRNLLELGSVSDIDRAAKGHRHGPGQIKAKKLIAVFATL